MYEKLLIFMYYLVDTNILNYNNSAQVSQHIFQWHKYFRRLRASEMAVSNVIKIATQAINVADKFTKVNTVKSEVPSQLTPTSSNNTTRGLPDQPEDLRIKISMPPDAPNIFYQDVLNPIMRPLFITSGFLFPIQPAISLTHAAEYQSVKPTHSNFPYHYYNNSEIQSISVTGEFPVRSVNDAQYVNAGIHFLRSCTRMFNGKDGSLSGAPPMVVRLKGLGFSGFDNIPVVITSVLVNYVDSVDYITFKPFSGTEKAKLPTLVSIQVNMSPVFSRDFITNQYSTKDYSTGKLRLLGNTKLVKPGTLSEPPPAIDNTPTKIQDLLQPVGGIGQLPGAVPNATAVGIENSLSNLPPPPPQQPNTQTSGPRIPGSPAGFGASTPPPQG